MNREMLAAKIKEYNYKNFLKKRYVIGGLLVVGALILIFGREDGSLKDLQTEAAVKEDVQETIIESGLVQASDSVDMVVERPGRLINIYVKEGDKVSQGQLLAQVDSRSAAAELASARARLQGEQARLDELRVGGSSNDQAVAQAGEVTAEVALQNAERNLEEVSRVQDALVQASYKTLISSDLRAYLIDGEMRGSDYSYIPPTISGGYEDDELGSYIVELYRSSSVSGYSFKYSGLESGIGTVSSNEPQPLGTKGLYIQFPDNFARGGNVRWEIPVPNTRSSSYIPNNQAYETAKTSRESAIQSAENAVRSARAGLTQTSAQNNLTLSPARSERVRAQEAVVNAARVAVWQAEITLSQTTVRAPFAGTVTSVDGVKGQFVSSAAPIVSLISDSKFELVVNIPESDVVNVQVGDSANITFDAYDDEVFKAKVVSINPAASNTEGVRSFKTTLMFDEENPKIRVGLTADIEIIAEEKSGVVAISSRAVFEEEGKEYVRIRNSNGEIVKREIVTGLKSSDGKIEIRKGLAQGDDVITFLNDKQLESLKKIEAEKNQKEN